MRLLIVAMSVVLGASIFAGCGNYENYEDYAHFDNDNYANISEIKKGMKLEFDGYIYKDNDGNYQMFKERVIDNKVKTINCLIYFDDESIKNELDNIKMTPYDTKIAAVVRGTEEIRDYNEHNKNRLVLVVEELEIKNLGEN